MPARILMAYDGSSTSEAALLWARDLARATGGAVTLFEVIPIPIPFAPEAVATSYPTSDDVAAVQNELGAVSARHGLTADLEVTVGAHVGESILCRARELGAALIVVGTHGRGVLARAVLGSVADYVVRHASCPVVTVGPDAARALASHTIPAIVDAREPAIHRAGPA